MSGTKEFGVDIDLSGNSVLNKGVESISDSVIITPTVLTTNRNNYNPTSLQVASVLRLETNGSNFNITGIEAPNPAYYKFLSLMNVGSVGNITLANNSNSSASINRFLLSTDIVLEPNSAIELFYDVSSGKWRSSQYWINTNSAPSRTLTNVNANYTITDSDRNISCSGNITVTLPLLSVITHEEDISIINDSDTVTDIVTINTTGGELLYDTTSFELYAGESLTTIKGTTKYLVK